MTNPDPHSMRRVPRSPEYEPPSRPHFLDQIADPSPTVSEPRTEAGRAFYERMTFASSMVGYDEEVRASILAIEAEAAQPIDVERLKEAIVKAAAFSDGSLTNLADLAAAAYARLTGEEG